MVNAWRSTKLSTNTSRFLGLLEEGDDFFGNPDMIGESSLHHWRHTERLMYAAELAVEV